MLSGVRREPEGMLSGLRALDLTDEKGWLCGRILADLGVEVIKVEAPGGDPCRCQPPFHQGQSLYWLTYNAGKKSVTLDLASPEGRGLFLKLVAKADFLLESFPPGYLGGLGLGYRELSRVNPGIILTSITPFGQTGPRRSFPASDITLQALGGIMFLTGEPERPPLRLCLDQSYMLASAHACAATLIALNHRRHTGLGQWVDVSIQECLVRLNYRDPVRWEVERTFSRRLGNRLVRGKVVNHIIWRCQDGYVTWAVLGGPPGARENYPLVKWMTEEKVPGVEALRGVKWEEVDLSRISQEELEGWEEVIGRFFLSHTKEELWQGSKQRRLTVVPVASAEEARHNEQLAARGFWEPMTVPGLGRVALPGQFFLSSVTSNRVRGPAPAPGEDNGELFTSLLGLSAAEVEALSRQGVV